MKVSNIFAFDRRPPVAPGTVRLTRLNIYSALYIEWRQIRVLVDPSYILPEVALELCPDVILVSHESMDHFDAELCLKLLSKMEAILIGSWGVVLALADYLATDDPLWQRIHVGIPGAVFQLGDLVIQIEEARHCEYAVPVFFDIRDARTGFRILDAVDTEITPRMERQEIAASPDILVVPLGIALAASPSQAWKMVELLQPAVVFANHFTREADDFRALASARYREDHRLIVLNWYQGVSLPGPDPCLQPQPVIWMSDSGAYPGLEHLLPAGIYGFPQQENSILEQMAILPWNAHSLATALYFLAWAGLRGRATLRALDMLVEMRERVFSHGNERLLASYLLAYGALAGTVSGAEARVDLTYFKTWLSNERPYLDYWILEAWGRAARNPALCKEVVGLLEEVAASKQLGNNVQIRRKLNWEVHRLVAMGHLWPGLTAALEKAATDVNPDVRLLTCKTLLQCYATVSNGPALLCAALEDVHDDVLEWALQAHIYLFDVLQPDNRRRLAARLPALLAHHNYHIRHKASALAVLCGGVSE